LRNVSIGATHLHGWLASPKAAVRGVALAATLFWVLVISFIAHARYDDDFRALLCVGEEMTMPALFATVPRVGPWGYDGQQYAALATDPLLRSPKTARSLDSPSYRATRVLVPLLAWLLALGNPAAAFVTYQFLCWGLAIGAVVLLASWLAAEGRSPWWALLLVSSAGLAAAVLRSTPDTGALFCLLAAVWAHSRGRRGWALALACAAVLARETSYLAALAMAADELLRRGVARAVTLAAVPLAIAVGWQLYLRSVLGFAFERGSGNFSLPFAWIPEKLAATFPGPHVWWAEVFGLLAIFATTVAFVLIAARPSAWRAPELAFLAFGGMGLFLGFTVYCETWAYARALFAVPFLAVLVAERQPRGWQRWSVRSVAVLYLLSGLVMVRGELRDARGNRGWLAALRGTASAPMLAPSQPPRPLYVLPVANAGGRAGAEWLTRLEVGNLARSENTIRFELIPADRLSSPTLRTTITLAEGQRRSWTNAAAELFAFSGSGALRLVPHAGPITAASITENVAAGVQQGQLLPALTSDNAVVHGAVARLSGLAHDPAPSAAVRTNVGFLNLTAASLSVRLELFDPGSRPLGQLSTELPPRGFLQMDNVFAAVRAPRVEGGWASVWTPVRGGAFLAYASVIRGPRASAVYVFPETAPAAAPAGR
jgi:hypothetical protein